MSGIIRAQRQRSPCRARIEGPAVPRACAGLCVVACATIRAVGGRPDDQPHNNDGSAKGAEGESQQQEYNHHPGLVDEKLQAGVSERERETNAFEFNTGIYNHNFAMQNSIHYWRSEFAFADALHTGHTRMSKCSKSNTTTARRGGRVTCDWLRSADVKPAGGGRVIAHYLFGACLQRGKEM